MTMRCLRPSSRRQCPHLGSDTAAFCSSLVEGLAHLESTLSTGGGGGGSVSMRWCADAMRLLKRMQRELLAIFKKAGVPVTVDSYGGGGGRGDWFEHYMQETAALLDFCNAFKSAVSRLHRYCMVVDFAAQVCCAAGGDSVVSLVKESAAPWPEELEASSAVRDKLSDVKAVVSETERLGRNIMSGSTGDDAGKVGMVVVTLVAKITMAVVSMFVLEALASPVPVDVGGRCMLGCTAVKVPELRPWCESLSLINDKFQRRARVAEHEKVAMAVRDMINAKMGGKERINGQEQEEESINGQEQEMVELLRTRSGELREVVEMFDCVLDEVFDEVIKGRNEMLGIFRDKALI